MKKTLAVILACMTSASALACSGVNAVGDANDVSSVSCDINGDGKFSVADVVALQKWLLSVPDVIISDWKAADLCEDDRLDVFDLVLMKRKLVGDENITLPTPDMYDTFEFKTYDELNEWLRSTDNENIERYGKQFPAFKKSMENCDTPLMIPVFSGNPAEIKGTAEWQNINLFTNELYNLPWIWYYCNYNSRCVVVGLSYLDYLSQMGINVPKDIKSFMDGIGLNGPNPENKDKYSDTYNDIYYDTLKTANGDVNTAVYDYKSGRTHYRFITDGCLLSVWDYSGEKLDDDFWKGFSLGEFAFTNDEPIETALRAKYPEYFDLYATKGLELYVWQQFKDEYRCVLAEGTNRNKTDEEIIGLFQNSTSVNEMKEILSCYDIPNEDIFITAWQHPLWEYAFPLVSNEKLREMFFGADENTLEFQITENVENVDFSQYNEIPGVFGARQFYGKGYAPVKDSEGNETRPEHYVTYLISAYPDYADGGQYVTQIEITDPKAVVHGLTVNSSIEEFETVLSDMGYTVTVNEYSEYSVLNAENDDGISYTFTEATSDRNAMLRIRAEVANRDNIIF